MPRPPFQPREAFAPTSAYRLLPFRFTRLRDDAYVVTNDVGEYVVLPREELVALIDKQLSPNTTRYRQLKSRHFLFDDDARAPIDLLALKYRTRAERLAWFTGLHIFVVTLRCDHSCGYCQVSRQTANRSSFDMSRAHAEKALELVWKSPSPVIKIEFQGGEPLLNFELIQLVVERAETMNLVHQRRLEFVIASNLSLLSNDILDFCERHNVSFSTSLDGPAALHDAQRPSTMGSTHARALRGIERIRARLGPNAVAALMTTTTASLSRVTEIIDEYVRHDFHSIFLRSLSPLGFAARKTITKKYDADDWVAFYERGLEHILALNHEGYSLREEYSAILLHKIFATEGTSYVDLQSPAGIGIGALVYNYDGAVYASDEGRMLAEMRDETFRLGHVDVDAYESMMTSEKLLGPLFAAMPEGSPMCSECAFLPYCGSDPVFHRATQGDEVGHKAFSAFCDKQTAVLRLLLTKLETDDRDSRVLRGWV